MLCVNRCTRFCWQLQVITSGQCCVLTGAQGSAGSDKWLLPGNVVCWQVHKVLLAATSDYFRAMLYVDRCTRFCWQRQVTTSGQCCVLTGTQGSAGSDKWLLPGNVVCWQVHKVLLAATSDYFRAMLCVNRCTRFCWQLQVTTSGQCCVLTGAQGSAGSYKCLLPGNVVCWQVHKILLAATSDYFRAMLCVNRCTRFCWQRQVTTSGQCCVLTGAQGSAGSDKWLLPGNVVCWQVHKVLLAATSDYFRAMLCVDRCTRFCWQLQVTTSRQCCVLTGAQGSAGSYKWLLPGNVVCWQVHKVLLAATSDYFRAMLCVDRCTRFCWQLQVTTSRQCCVLTGAQGSAGSYKWLLPAMLCVDRCTRFCWQLQVTTSGQCCVLTGAQGSAGSDKWLLPGNVVCWQVHKVLLAATSDYFRAMLCVDRCTRVLLAATSDYFRAMLCVDRCTRFCWQRQVTTSGQCCVLTGAQGSAGSDKWLLSGNVVCWQVHKVLLAATSDYFQAMLCVDRCTRFCWQLQVTTSGQCCVLTGAQGSAGSYKWLLPGNVVCWQVHKVLLAATSDYFRAMLCVDRCTRFCWQLQVTTSGQCCVLTGAQGSAGSDKWLLPGNVVCWQVHKVLLAATSDYFRAMLCVDRCTRFCWQRQVTTFGQCCVLTGAQGSAGSYKWLLPGNVVCWQVHKVLLPATSDYFRAMLCVDRCTRFCWQRQVTTSGQCCVLTGAQGSAGSDKWLLPGNVVCWQVHKVLLAATSDYFRAMLCVDRCTRFCWQQQVTTSGQCCVLTGAHGSAGSDKWLLPGNVVCWQVHKVLLAATSDYFQAMLCVDRCTRFCWQRQVTTSGQCCVLTGAQGSAGSDKWLLPGNVVWVSTREHGEPGGVEGSGRRFSRADCWLHVQRLAAPRRRQPQRRAECCQSPAGGVRPQLVPVTCRWGQTTISVSHLQVGSGHN